MDRRSFLQLLSGCAAAGAMGSLLNSDNTTPLLGSLSDGPLFPGLPVRFSLSPETSHPCHVALVLHGEGAVEVAETWTLTPGQAVEFAMPAPNGRLSSGSWTPVLVARSSRGELWDRRELGLMRVKELRFGA